MALGRRALPCLVLLILALAPAGCGGGGVSTPPINPPHPPPPPPPTPGFTVNVQAPTVPLQIQGISSGQQVSVQASGGFSGTVSLSLQNLPAGVTTSPAFPIELSAGQSTFFSLIASAAANASTSMVTVLGTSGSVTNSTAFSVQVRAAARQFAGLRLATACRGVAGLLG